MSGIIFVVLRKISKRSFYENVTIFSIFNLNGFQIFAFTSEVRGY